MSLTVRYITDAQFEAVLEALDLDSTEDDEKQELLDRAIGDLEADLVQRFEVPLLAKSGGAFETAPEFARNKVLNALKSKIRQLIGADKARNLVLETTQKYVDVYKGLYRDDIAALLDPKRDFGFKLLPYTEDSAVPVQSIELARADNNLHVRGRGDPWY